MANEETALSGQITVITGASRGIGQAIALELARHGMSLCLLGRDRAALDSVAATLEPARARVFPVDLSQEDQLARVVERLQEVGRIDVLVHNAALVELGSFQSASVETFDALYRVNVRAPFALTQALLPQLIASKGQIVFINSTLGLTARRNFAQYAATKHALKGLADALREEVNPDGVRVISVYPGQTATDMQVAIHAYNQREYDPDILMQPADVAHAVASVLLSPRTAEISDLQIRPMRR